MKTKIKRHSRSVISVILAVCMLVSCMTVGLIATDAAKVQSESVGAWNIKDSIEDAKVYGNFNYDSPSTQSEWTYNQMNRDSSNHYWATFVLKASTTFDFKLQSQESGNWKFRGANGSEFTFTSSATEYIEPVDSNDKNFHVTTKSSGSGYVSVRFDYWGEYSGRCKLFVTQQDVSNFYIHKSTSDQGATTASGTAMTNSSGTYTTTLSKNTDHYLMFNASSTASKMELATYAKVLSDKITLEAGGSAGSGDYAGYTEITKDWSQVKIVKVRCNTKDISVAFHPSTGKVEFDTITTIADNYYLGGRLTIKDGNGDPVYTGDSAGDWGDPSHAPTNKLAFTQVTAGTDYTVDTRCTISELSDPARHNNKEPLFIVYDSSDNVYATTGDAGLTFHTNIDSSKANITEFSGTLQKANEFLFDDVENNSDGLVTIHYDPTNEKIWYTLTGETPALAENATLSVVPASTEIGTEVTLTAGHGTLTSPVTEASLTYTFYKNGEVIHTGTDKTYKDTEQDVRINTYKVVISTSEIYTTNNKPYREVWAKQNADFTNPDYFRTNLNLYGLDDDERETAVITAASWYSGTDAGQHITAGAMPHAGDYKFDVTLSAGQTYEFALCKTAIPDGDESHLKDHRADEFFVDMSDSMYCDITSDSVTVSYQDGEETVRYTVTTYKVTPRTGCANATIHINTNGYARTVGSSTRYYPGRIYALSTYSPTHTLTENQTAEDQYVTYYFAEATDIVDDSKTGAGMAIAYWNNSKDIIRVNDDFKYDNSSSWNHAIKGNATAVSVDTAVKLKNGELSTASDSSNQITVDMRKLYKTNSNDDNTTTAKTFNVYSVKLPIFATSFAFVKKAPMTADSDVIKTHSCSDQSNPYDYSSILLNPNRVYLLYKSNDEYYSKGVVLDKGLWNSTTKNDVGTRSFKSNVINYNKAYSGSVVQAVDGSNLNSVLSAKYTQSDYKRALYFGYFPQASTASSTGLKNFKITNNLAMRTSNEKDERYYHASIWGLVAEKLDLDNLNSNGFPTLMAYADTDKTQKMNMPLFDYEMLAKDKTTSQNTIIDRQYLGVNFPMYESSFNGIKTYSYDSSTDPNRSIAKITPESGPAYYDFHVGSYEKAAADLGYKPFKDCDQVASGVSKDYGNATELDVKFYMSNTGQIKGTDGTMEDIAFNFTGDDDVWVYVDGVLVLDLGGAHKASAGTINFSDMKVYYKTAAKDCDAVTGINDTFPVSTDTNSKANTIYTVDMAALMAANGVRFSKTDAATEHTFQMFYMERGEIDSNMSVSFNLPQASGLNIRNKVTFDHVNPGLLGATQYSSNKDYFTFGVDSALSKTGSGHDVAKVSAAYSNVKTAATTGSTAAATPVFPAHSATNHVFSTSYNTRDGKGAAIVNKTFNGPYPLTRSDTTLEETGETSGSKAYTQTDEFGDPSVAGSHFVDHVPYTITDTLLQPVTPGDTDQEVVGVTSSTGQLRLLGTQMATFDDKFLPGSFVKVYMTQDLGEVDPSGKVIKYKSVADNNVGNYYITSYSIQDNHSSTWIKEQTNVPLMHDGGEDIYAEDLSSNTDHCFYFSDYGTNGNTETAAMTVEYTNDVAVGDIKITKVYNGEDNPDFTFYLKFSQIFGDSSDQTADAVEYTDILYDVYKSDGTPVHRGVKYGRAGIVIKKDEIAVISGVPVETRYQVIEDNRAGSYLSEIDKKIYDAHGNEGIPHATPTHRYVEHFTEAQITGSGRTGTSTNSETISGDVYHVNMIPRVSESAWHDNDTSIAHWDDSYVTDHANQIYKTTSLITFTNKKTMIKVMLKYYDRVVQNGSETGLSKTPTSYTYRISQADINSHSADNWYTYAEAQLQSIDYAKIVSFVTGKAKISNVIADYTFWPTNDQALAGIKDTTKAYYTNGETADTAKYSSLYSVDDLAYHTSYIGVPVSDRARTDKWVCFKDNKGNILDFDAPSTPEQYASIATIEVWGYNTPKKYTIKAHNLTVAEGQYAAQGTEYAAGGATYDETSHEAPAYIVGTGVSNTLSNYLYNTRVGGSYWAHIYEGMTDEQIAAENAKVALLNRPSTYFQDGYGLTKGYTGEYPAAEKDFRYEYTNKSSEQVTARYVFAYWASDREGKNKITTDYQYGYRITKNMDIYPVYVLGSANEGMAVSITASQPDMYTKNDTLYRRINNIIGVYNVEPNDDKLTELAVLYVRLGKDANNGKTTEVDETKLDVNAIKNNYLAALAELDSWGYAKAATVYIDVTAQTTPENASSADKRRGTTYKYQVSFVPSENMPSTQVLLNNKNRMMMTHGFNNDLFAENAAFHKMLCFAAAKYDGHWIASDNYVYYEGGIPQ